MSRAVISVRDLYKSYGGKLAVAGLSLEVDEGQIWGIVGHNGAGKTTTMRSIAGLLPPSAGEIAIQGHLVGEDNPNAKKLLAYLPDDPQLFEALTVGEHIRFTSSAYQLHSDLTATEDLLDCFELAEQIETPAEDLSRGMRQKLAICCAYLRNPKAIMFDEPFTGLDPLGIRRLKESIRDRASSGSAIMVSSHLLAMVEDLCTHILILSRGKPTFSGTLQALLDQFEQSEENTLEEIFFRATELGELFATSPQCETEVSQEHRHG